MSPLPLTTKAADAFGLTPTPKDVIAVFNRCHIDSGLVLVKLMFSVICVAEMPRISQTLVADSSGVRWQLPTSLAQLTAKDLPTSALVMSIEFAFGPTVRAMAGL